MLARVTLGLALAVAGCSSAPAASPRRAGERAVLDGMGRTVRLPAAVARVVSLAPSSTEILWAVGAGPLVVGLDRYSDWPPETARIERVGADLDPSLERIVALRPDVVFTARTANNQRTVEALERAGLSVYVSHAERLDAIFDDVERIAAAVGRAAQGRALAASLRARRDAVVARTAKQPRVKAAVVVWSEPLIVAGPGSQVDEALADAGGENVAADAAPGYPSFSAERLIARAPEVVFVGTHANGETDPARAFAAKLPTLPAVRAGRVLPIDGDLLFRPGPRIVEALERLARGLHP